MERKELAVQLKHNRHNCCQAVLCAFADRVDVPEDLLRKLGAGFGIGMGGMEGTCGALVAAEMLLGIERFEGRPVIRDAGELHARFADRCGATICKDLKGRDTGVVLCDCDDCVRHAVELVEELL
ncbi:MAG: C_GCAxxG_C_C family protein [Atopobiaceae bacterium]|nr:C_GCAxxG_C_C family protein [Atopobiaceae bacterium]